MLGILYLCTCRYWNKSKVERLPRTGLLINRPTALSRQTCISVFVLPQRVAVRVGTDHRDLQMPVCQIVVSVKSADDPDIEPYG